ncbi:MAG: hypothetical protein VW804_07480 [Verrucomicrobiota bacterium]
MIYFEKSTILPVKASELYRWHMRPEAFETLTPPWEPVKVLQRPLVLEEGSELHLQVPLGPLRVLWMCLNDLSIRTLVLSSYHYDLKEIQTAFLFGWSGKEPR